MPVSNQVQRLIISGELGSASFLPWVARHSLRLGLACKPIRTSPAHAEFEVSGQPELIDALEVGCLLGPFDVWVETIERRPAGLSK